MKFKMADISSLKLDFFDIYRIFGYDLDKITFMELKLFDKSPSVSILANFGRICPEKLLRKWSALA